MRRIALLLLPAALALLGGCNTIKGFGTDVHDIAQNTQDFIEGGSGYTTDSRTPSPGSGSGSRSNYRRASVE